jgi:hypothetical protein
VYDNVSFEVSPGEIAEEFRLEGRKLLAFTPIQYPGKAGALPYICRG